MTPWFAEVTTVSNTTATARPTAAHCFFFPFACVQATSNFTYHAKVDRQLAFLCLADNAVTQRCVVGCLNAMNKRFLEEYALPPSLLSLSLF